MGVEALSDEKVRELNRQRELADEYKAQRDSLNRAVSSFLRNPCEETRNLMLVAHYACERERRQSYAIDKINEYYKELS